MFRRSKVIIGFIFLLFTINLEGQSRNLQSIVIGDQAAGMGGAYTALFADPSANAYYNPAGFAFSESTSVSASVGVYKKFDLNYNANRDLLTASFNMNQGFFRAVPASTSATYRDFEWPFLSDVTVAMSILVPHYEEFSGDLVRGSDFVSRLNYRSESLWVGTSVSKRLDTHSSFGLSLFYTAHTTFVERSFRSESLVFYDYESRTVKANNMVMILGYQQEAIDKQSRWGVSWQLPGLKISGIGERDYFRLSGGALNQNPQRQIAAEYRVPSQISLGGAWQLSSTWLLAADIRQSFAVGQSDFISDSFQDHYDLLATLNASLGVTWNLHPQWEWRAGVFTDHSPHLKHKDLNQKSWQADAIDQFGFSSNLAYKKKNMEYTFGGYYVGGRGQAWMNGGVQYEPLSKVTHIFTMLVGVQYSQ